MLSKDKHSRRRLLKMFVTTTAQSQFLGAQTPAWSRGAWRAMAISRWMLIPSGSEGAAIASAPLTRNLKTAATASEPTSAQVNSWVAEQCLGQSSGRLQAAEK